MHKRLNIADLQMRALYWDLYKWGRVTRAEYMGVQARHRPGLQSREAAEPLRPRKRRALAAAGPRR